MSTVTREIQIDAPVPTVWRHISDPDERSRWLGGDLDVDLSPGRRGRFGGPDLARPVQVDDVDEGRSVTFTWGEDDEASQVRIEVEPDGEGSRVRVTESTAGEQPATRPRETEPLAALSFHRAEEDGPAERDLDEPAEDVGVIVMPGGTAPPAPIARAA